MTTRFFMAKRDEGRWRIVEMTAGTERDICGAVDQAVARAQCAILNQMYGGTR